MFDPPMKRSATSNKVHHDLAEMGGGEKAEMDRAATGQSAI